MRHPSDRINIWVNRLHFNANYGGITGIIDPKKTIINEDISLQTSAVYSISVEKSEKISAPKNKENPL